MTWNHPRHKRNKGLRVKKAGLLLLCDACGEEIVIPLDASLGTSQEFVEDRPVCCCPNVLHIEIDEDGEVNVRAEPE